MVVGSGVQGYDGRAAGGASIFAVQLVLPGTTPTVTVMPVGSSTYGSYMSDPITFDRDLDFRSDAVYIGRTIDPDAGAPGTLDIGGGSFIALLWGHVPLLLVQLPHGELSQGQTVVRQKLSFKFPSAERQSILGR